MFQPVGFEGSRESIVGISHLRERFTIHAVDDKKGRCIRFLSSCLRAIDIEVRDFECRNFFQVWMEKGSGLTVQREGYTIRGSGVRVEGVTDMQFAA